MADGSNKGRAISVSFCVVVDAVVDDEDDENDENEGEEEDDDDEDNAIVVVGTVPFSGLAFSFSVLATKCCRAR